MALKMMAMDMTRIIGDDRRFKTTKALETVQRVDNKYGSLMYQVSGRQYRVVDKHYSEYWGTIYDMEIVEIKNGDVFFRQGTKEFISDMMAVDFLGFHHIPISTNQILKPLKETAAQVFGHFVRDMVMRLKELEDSLNN